MEQLRAWGPREGRVPSVGSHGQVDSLCSVLATEASWEASRELSESWGATRAHPAEAVCAARQRRGVGDERHSGQGRADPLGVRGSVSRTQSLQWWTRDGDPHDLQGGI